MGRPLKIAKSTAVIGITATSSVNNAVTTSANLNTLGIIPGQRFVLSSSIGGLVAGTTYWFLSILSPTTFTVSAADLSANTSKVPITLTTASGSSNATVDGKDFGFSNPAGYGVLGGNTSQYVTTVLANVAIGISGTGVIYASSATPNVYGSGTSFASQLSAGSALQVISGNIGNTKTNIGFVSSVASANLAVTGTVAAGNFITTSGNAQTLATTQPISFTANLSNIVANTVYYVGTIANTTSFTVTTTPSGAPLALGTASGTTYALQEKVILAANATANATANSFVFSNAEAGFIVRQKGKQKYLVQGNTSGLQARADTANIANAALTPNTMSITAIYANAATQKVQSLSDHTADLFTATSGVTGSINQVSTISNSAPVFATFGAAANANASLGIQFPVVTIANL